METRANYALIGLFMLAVTAGAFATRLLVLACGRRRRPGNLSSCVDGAVSGLRTGGAVFFNGIKDSVRSLISSSTPKIRARSLLL